MHLRLPHPYVKSTMLLRFTSVMTTEVLGKDKRQETTMKDAVWLLAVVGAAVWGLMSSVAPPTKMVIIAFWVFFVIKLQAWSRSQERRTQRSMATSAIQWFLLTPTLDASQFFRSSLPAREKPTRRQWGMAVLKTVTGVFLFFVVAGLFVQRHGIVAGWIAMTGIVMSLHFGLL